MGAGRVEVILLDTNYLIHMLVRGTRPATLVPEWLTDGVDLCTSAICWYEFVSGPVDEDGIALAIATVDDRIIPFTAAAAQEASRLCNATGRRRRMRIDAMIAATAVITSASLATENSDDFAAFVELGLQLNEISAD